MLHVKETSLKTAKDATSILKSISKVAAQAQADIKPKPGGGGGGGGGDNGQGQN